MVCLRLLGWRLTTALQDRACSGASGPAALVCGGTVSDEPARHSVAADGSGAERRAGTEVVAERLRRPPCPRTATRNPKSRRNRPKQETTPARISQASPPNLAMLPRR